MSQNPYAPPVRLTAAPFPSAANSVLVEYDGQQILMLRDDMLIRDGCAHVKQVLAVSQERIQTQANVA